MALLRRPVRILAVGLLLALVTAAARPAQSAPPTAPQAPAAVPSTSVFDSEAAARTFTSERHAYTLTLPVGWHFLPPNGPDDFADVRFEGPGEGVHGFYQVFEQTRVDDAQEWYDEARKRYKEAARKQPDVRRLDVSSLIPAHLGPHAAHSFTLDTVASGGRADTTRIVFLARGEKGQRDMHELIVTGGAPAMREVGADLDSMCRALVWIHEIQPAP